MRLLVGFGSLWVSDLYPSFLTGREWGQELREGEGVGKRMHTT